MEVDTIVGYNNRIIYPMWFSILIQTPLIALGIHITNPHRPFYFN